MGLNYRKDLPKYIYSNKFRHHRKNRTIKFKYLILIGLVGVFTVGGLAVWGLVSISQSVIAAVSTNSLKEKGTELASTVGNIADKPITTKECINTLVDMVSPEKWLTVSLAKNVSIIKDSCSGSLKSTDEKVTI